MPQNNTNFMLAPGEDNVYGGRFIESLVLPFLKAELMCSTTRFVFKDPNTILGVIPLGYNEATYPLASISNVATSMSLRIWRLVLGLLGLFLGLSELSHSIPVGLVVTLLGVVFLLTCLPVVLVVQNHAGGTAAIEVSIIEKSRLETFAQELKARVFADQSQIHHEEAQLLRAQQVTLQQLGLQQQMNMQQQANSQQMQAAQGTSQVQPVQPPAQADPPTLDADPRV